MKKDKVPVSENVSFEQSADPSIAHHVERMHPAAKKSGKAERFVLAAGMMDEGEGERVLTVKPDGTHEIKFERSK